MKKMVAITIRPTFRHSGVQTGRQKARIPNIFQQEARSVNEKTYSGIRRRSLQTIEKHILYKPTMISGFNGLAITGVIGVALVPWSAMSGNLKCFFAYATCLSPKTFLFLRDALEYVAKRYAFLSIPEGADRAC